MRWLGPFVGVAGIVLGVGAELAGFGWDDPRHWIPDLAVGWSFLGCGLWIWVRRPGNHTGALMVATGITWFLGNLDPRLLFLHRGPLVHCALAYPDRLKSRAEMGATGLAYAAAAAWPLGESEPATLALATLLVAVALHGYLRAVGRDRRARVPGVRAAVAFGFALGGAAGAHLAFPAGDANELVLAAYQATLIAIAFGFVFGLEHIAWEPPVTDLVVELGETRSTTLRDALARALDDPSLEIGYRDAGTNGYIDAEGHPVALPAPDSGRAVTAIEREAERVVVLVHDPAVLDDPSLVGSVATAARLTASNARLQVQVRAQVAELQASRRRLVAAGDAERKRLEERLRRGAEHRLVDLAAQLERLKSEWHGTRGIEKLADAESQLHQTLDDLRELAAGLHPRLLAERGLPDALADLARRSALPIDLNVLPGARPPREVEAAAYFVCSEALANAAKYASATRVSVALAHRQGRLMIEVSDDGIGGADASRGSGLRGLIDRIEALGGVLRVDSPRGGGTRLSAEIPLDGAELDSSS